MIYVITSLVNGHDNLRAPLIDPAGARFICFTNDPHAPRIDLWEYRPVYDVGQACRTARVPKILPHLMLPDDCEYSIWHDANFQLAMPPQKIIETTLARHDWAVHTHPGRPCAYLEGEHCIELGIGTPELLRAEMDKYRAWGHPEQAGLWANGFLVRRHTDATKRLCERWWELYSAGGERDQISFPVARRQSNMELNTLPYSIWTTPLARFHFHAAWLTRSENESYLPERAKVRKKLERLQEVTGSCGGIQWPEQ